MEGPTPIGTSYAEKFGLLLDTFPHPSRAHLHDEKKRRWKSIELEAASGGRLSAAYLSALKNGKILQPGLEHLDSISRVMGFPVELWLLEPAQWENRLESAGSRRRPTERGSEVRHPDELLNQLFESIPNRRTGRAFSNREVADLSGDRLTEDDVVALRDGSLPNPTRAQLLALCDVFDVDFSYWADTAGGKPGLDPEIVEALRDQRLVGVLHKSRGLSSDQVDMLALLADQFGRHEGGGGEKKDAP